MGREEYVGGQRPTAPAAELASDAGQPPWAHEAPTRPNAHTTLTTEEKPASAATSNDSGERTPEPMSRPMEERLSDPCQFFDEATPPPVLAQPRHDPLIEERPRPVRNRYVGGFLVTLSMGLSVLILFAATIVRVRAAFVDDRPRGLASAPASSPVLAIDESRLSESAAAETPPSVDPLPTTGELRLGAPVAGHRVIVDDDVIREPSSSLQLPCGEHTVRIGYAGKARSAIVPCGGSVTVVP
jgi:hypothetical protein